MNPPGSERLLGVLIDPLAEREFARGRPPEHAYPHLGPFARRRGLRAVFFSPNGVDRRTGTAAGWEYADGRWQRSSFPLPTAVYNRLARRSLERRAAARRLVDHLKRSGLFFNPRFVAKDEALEALRKRGVPAPRLVLARTPGDVADAARAFGAVYLKPVDGSLGRGIARVERLGGKGSGRFGVAINPAAPAPPERMEGDLQFLLDLARRLLKTGSFVVQEGVELPRIAGGPADLRALVQRTGTGWSLTGVAGRAALPGHLSTHTVRGGRRVPFSEVAGLCGVTRGAVEELAVRAAAALEAEFGETFFEFSADIAPTPGGLLVLEVNAKPFPFDEDEIREEAARRLFEFAGGLPRERAGPRGIG